LYRNLLLQNEPNEFLLFFYSNDNWFYELFMETDLDDGLFFMNPTGVMNCLLFTHRAQIVSS